MPLPTAGGSVSPATGNGTSLCSGLQKRKRKRTRSGRQAEPRTSAASNIAQQQQTPEHLSPIPPIKLRRVDGGRWRVVSSFAAPSMQNPLATESVITADEASQLQPQPEAVIEPESVNPPPANESTTPVSSEMEDEGSEDATEISPELLSVFVPEQREVLKQHYNDRNPNTAQAMRRVVANAKNLLKTLRIRKIGLSYSRGTPPLPTLFNKLKTFSLIQKSEFFSTYFAKATVFFSAVNTAQIKNTGCLSSMLFRNPKIESFAKRSDEEIRFIATHPFLKQISSMRNNRGFPTIGEVEDFMNMACLKAGWQPGSDETVQGNPVDQELLVHISSMHNCRGFPTKEQVEAFIGMPCLKEGWRPGCDEDVKDNLVDRKLLMHIASMNHCKGFPSEAQVKAFITMPCLKMGWEPGCDEAVKDNPVDWKLLKRIASMNNGKGMPTEAQVKAFITMLCLRVDWRPGNDEAVKDNPIDQNLLKQIASMNNGRGIPTKDQVEAFMSMPCLRVGWQTGYDEAVKDKPIDRELLIRIASMNHGKGFLTEAQVEAFITMPCLKVGWQPGRDAAVRDNPIDRELLMRIASMNSGKGFPTAKQVKAFITMPCLKVGWQPDKDRAVKNNLIDRELLKRIASMNHGKGFPTSPQVKAFITMPCLKVGWQPGNDEVVKDNPVDWDLLIHIASMRNGKGLPTERQVKAFITMPCLKEDWQWGRDAAVKNNPVDRELLTHIASINNGKDFPTKEQVEAFITMPCLKVGWQPGGDRIVVDNPIDRGLLIKLASMSGGRGLPTRSAVEAFITMPCLKVGWQPGLDAAVTNNPIDRSLLKSIASINSGRGFPTEWQVKAFITMPCLKVDWQPGRDEAVIDSPIDQKLFMHIASMNHRLGFPARELVKAFMSMPCLKVGWQPGNDEAVKDNPIDRKLIVRIASMNHGKGLPTRGQVEAFISMLCLKVDWQPGREEHVKDNPIDWQLLMRIASINDGKGMPTEAQVRAFITMPCLKKGWQPGKDEAVKNSPVDHKLLMHIASINNRRGFPTKEQVEAFTTMPCLKEGWREGNDEAVQNNLIDWKLLVYIAGMNNGKGFPMEADVMAFVQWLPVKNRKNCLEMASRVFFSAGLPKLKELTTNERIIQQYLPDLPELSIETDYDISDLDDEWEEGDAVNALPLFSSFPQKWRMTIAENMKVLALFSSAPLKWRMTIAEFEQYLTTFTNARNERPQVLSALASLLPILHNHGGAGVRLWLARHNESRQDQNLLNKALSIPAPLNIVKFALTQLPESESLEYIELCKNLSPPPNKAQWEALETLRQKLNRRFIMARSRRWTLEIIWSQPEAKSPDYIEQLDSFFETAPSILQLYRIHLSFGQQKMQGFLDACIARQTANSLNLKEQERLLEGLLVAHHYLTDHEQIPDLCFSLRMASNDGKGVIIRGDALMSGLKRLWYFIAALLIELEQAPEYKFEKQQLTILSGSGTMTLPKPEFSLVGNGFMIKNWSLEQLNAFFEATDFTERWYKHPQEEREAYVIRRDERLAGRRARAIETQQAGNNRTTPLLPPGVILSLIKSGRSLKPAVWASLEQYANNGLLTVRLCRALVPVIESQVTIVPDTVKNAVTATLAEMEAEEATRTQPSPAINELTFKNAMDALSRFEVLEKTELEMLQAYRDQMTLNQLDCVIHKMGHGVDLETQLDWHTAYEDKKRDPLGLNELRPDLFH